jgi:Zn-dependent protease with chaperone function
LQTTVSVSNENSDLPIQQVAKLNSMISKLSEKAGLRRVPGLVISKNERFASVNVFSFRIGVGENLLSLWSQGKFDDSDMEAAIAHEIGHLMDFKSGSRTSSFRNLLLESAWLSCGLVPLVVCILFPSALTIKLSVGFALGWGISIPLLIRTLERKIEFEADRNAALYLVEPAHLANALSKIKALCIPVKCFALSGRVRGIVGMLTHPSFDDRISRLNGLSQFGVTLLRLWETRTF